MADVDLELDQDQDWFVRDNLEFDEKLPLLAYEVIERGINFLQLDTDEKADPEVVYQIVEVMKTFLDGFSELTADEVECFISRIVVACGIEYYLNEGLEDLNKDLGGALCQNEEGDFYISKGTSPQNTE